MNGRSTSRADAWTSARWRFTLIVPAAEDLLVKSMARTCRSALLALPLFATAAAAQSPSLTIEKLITDGWEVAGYISAWENRSLILFKHKDHKYLVQCSVLVDVTRAQRLVTVCYELK
jgi:hypothetical protein